VQEKHAKSGIRKLRKTLTMETTAAAMTMAKAMTIATGTKTMERTIRTMGRTIRTMGRTIRTMGRTIRTMRGKAKGKGNLRHINLIKQYVAGSLSQIGQITKKMILLSTLSGFF
jgi:hypothetical protein